MPEFQGPGLSGSATMDEMRDYIIRLERKLNYTLNMLESVNIREIGNWRVEQNRLVSKDGDVGMSTEDTSGDDVRFWAGDAMDGAPAFIVTKSGKMYALDGTFKGTISASEINGGEINGSEINAAIINGGEMNAAIINGGQINATEINGSDINGSTITGGVLRTDETGSRIEVEEGQIRIYQSDDTLRMVIDSTVSPPQIVFYDAFGIAQAGISLLGGLLTMASETGTVIGNQGEDNLLVGRTVFSGWSNLYSNFEMQTLQQALNNLQNQINDLEDDVYDLELRVSQLENP